MTGLLRTPDEVRSLGGYKIIYADPAWEYRDSSGRGAAENHYGTMPDDDLASLPVRDIAADDCALFMWATYPKIAEALALGAAWGFEYKTLAFQWVKYFGNSCRLFYGNGRWTRANTEPVLLFTRGKPKRVNLGVDQLIETIEELDDRTLQAAHSGKHSEKPDEVRHRIRRLMGDISAIELFARQRAEGFDAWGDDPELGAPDVLLTVADYFHLCHWPEIIP